MRRKINSISVVDAVDTRLVTRFTLHIAPYVPRSLIAFVRVKLVIALSER